MKHLLRVNFLFFILLIACGQTTQIAPTQDMTSLPTPSLVPSQTATIAITPTPTRSFPTLIPTIDPNLASDLLRKSISLQTLQGINGHSMQRITGWEYGFRQRLLCPSYQWLDSNHLLLYPRTGEGMLPHMDGSIRADLSSKAMVVNLTTGTFWLLSLPSPINSRDCNLVYWSRELSLIINQENSGGTSEPTADTVVIYAFDGDKVSEYKGILNSVSSSGEKILVNDKTMIDLRNNKVTDLAWHIDHDLDRSLGILPTLYWSSDENRVYRCCFYFADLKTGKSYNFEWSDLHGTDGKPAPFSLNPHSDGQWVRNDTYFLVKWSYPWWPGDPDLIFSPSEKKYFYIKDTEILPLYASYDISPDGMYVWISGFLDIGSDKPPHGSLVNLTTLETTLYNDIPVNDFVWSPDSKFGWTDGYDSNNAYMLSVDTKKLLPFPVNPRYDIALWHPKDHVLAYMTENDQTLALLNAEDMTIQGRKLPISAGFLWSPNGDRLVFISKDRGIWQVDYPTFENFEQLTEPMSSTINDILWSPDGNSLAFISGQDIYIVDITK